MPRLSWTATAATALALTLTLPSSAAALTEEDQQALAAVAILGLAAVAVANHHDDEQRAHRRVESEFSPAAGVVCYERQHTCYYSNGHYASRWTWRVYHR